jgi:hypothetical protein
MITRKRYDWVRKGMTGRKRKKIEMEGKDREVRRGGGPKSRHGGRLLSLKLNRVRGQYPDTPFRVPS